MTAWHIAWVVVGCLFAEAAFLLMQILLTLLFLPPHYSLSEMLLPHNPLYALPPHFAVPCIVFPVTALYGQMRRIRTPFYYMGCGLIAAIAFHETVFIFDKAATQAANVVIDLFSAVFSGLVYWYLSPRRMA